MIDRVYDFGMRRIVVCLSSDKTEGMRRRHADDVSGKAGVTLVRCGGSSSTIVAAAAEIAAADPQAVISTGTRPRQRSSSKIFEPGAASPWWS